MGPGRVMNAISRMSPPHAGHASGNSFPTLAISFAQARRQWVISLPKRLRGVLGDRPKAVAAVTRIFLDQRDVFQPSPDELPAIDIHSL